MCVSSIFQFFWNGNSFGRLNEMIRRTPGKTSRSPEYRSTNRSRVKTRRACASEYLRWLTGRLANGYSSRSCASAAGRSPRSMDEQTSAIVSLLLSTMNSSSNGPGFRRGPGRDASATRARKGSDRKWKCRKTALLLRYTISVTSTSGLTPCAPVRIRWLLLKPREQLKVFGHGARLRVFGHGGVRTDNVLH